MRLSAGQYRPFGKSGLPISPIVFGSRALGKLRPPIPGQTRMEICCEWFRQVAPPVTIATAGKYGAGLALKTIGKALRRLEIGRDEVILINQLGWTRAPASAAQSTSEQGARLGLEHDAVQRIGHDGILRCWEESCRLLGDSHVTQLASVHDPDQYLAAATSPADRDRRFQDVLDAYRALGQLKSAGEVVAIGAGATDWQVIQEINAVVELDWVMLSGSVTIMHHRPDVLEFVAGLAERRIAVINSGLLHGGFLTGGKYYNCRAVSADNDADRPLLAWRKSFAALCEGHGVAPVDACVQFGLSVPGVVAARLDTSHPDRISANVDAVTKQIPGVFWGSMKEEGLIAEDYPYVGSSPSPPGRGPG